MTLDELNTAPPDAAAAALFACCGSRAWANRLLQARPYGTAQQLHSQAETAWNSLSKDDWLEAFSQHPKIGERSSSAWSAQEQRGMSTAPVETSQAMHDLNISYQRKFGWIFIVCATGKSAEEMLGLVRIRLHNDPASELRTAAAEQAKIMHLRLDKLLTQ